MSSELSDADFIARLEAQTVVYNAWLAKRKSAGEKLVALGLSADEVDAILNGPKES